MSPELARREVALAAVAVLAVVLALALGSLARESDAAAGEDDRSVPVEETGWYSALAAPYAFEGDAERTACGQPTGPDTLGVAHPVLPCGAKIVLRYEGVQVLTQVIDRGPELPGREFAVTQPLAARMQLNGVQTIGWRFAQ